MRGLTLGIISAVVGAVLLTALCTLFYDPLMLLLIAALATCVTPRRLALWIPLLGWSFFLLGQGTREAILWSQGNTKFGSMAIPYGGAGLILFVASVLSYRRTRA